MVMMSDIDVMWCCKQMCCLATMAQYLPMDRHLVGKHTQWRSVCFVVGNFEFTIRIMHTELHWLDVPERINYKLGMLMYWCQHNKAPRYLMDHCRSVSDVAYRQWLVLPVVSVPQHRLSTYGRRAFAVGGLTVWNSLPEDMRDPDVSEDSHRQSLKTFLFSQY